MDVETPAGVFRIHALGFNAGDTALYRFTGSVVHTLNGSPTFLSSGPCRVKDDTWYTIAQLYQHDDKDGGHCTRWPESMTDDVANERKDAATAAGFTRFDDDEEALDKDRYKSVWINATHPCFGSPSLSAPYWETVEGAEEAVSEGWDDYKFDTDFGGCFDDDNVQANGYGPGYCRDAQLWTRHFLRHAQLPRPPPQ